MYNSKIHHRRSIRLKGYDYSQAGAYFITICCQDRKCGFGNVRVPLAGAPPEMELSEYGLIAYNKWMKLFQRFSNFELDVFQIMPNHMHGIVVLGVGATLAVAPTVGDIIGAYKSLVANECLALFKLKFAGAGVNPAPYMGKFWQRNYYEHIIRDEKSYQMISGYIVNNPANWKNDKFFNP